MKVERWYSHRGADERRTANGSSAPRKPTMSRHIAPPGPPTGPTPGRIPDEGGTGFVAQADDAAPSPDVVVVGGHLFVTAHVSEIPADQLTHYVGTNLLVVWRKDEPEEACVFIRFPVDVDPQRAVVRITNGVLDLEVPVARSPPAQIPPQKDLPLG